MPQNTAITDKFLTNISNKLTNKDFLTEKILPIVKVKETSGKIANYGNGHLRIETSLHVGRGPYPRVDSVTRSSDLYSLENHGLQATLTDEDFRNVEKPYDAKVDETDALTSHLMLEKEVGLATILQDPAIITHGKPLSGNSQYNNRSHADSNPLEDRRDAGKVMLASIGSEPNAVVMDDAVFGDLRVHEELLRSLGFADNRAGRLSEQELAKALDVDMIFVGKAIFNSAKEGQTDVIARVWGKDVIYVKVGRPALRQKVLGYTLQKTGRSSRVVQTMNNFTPRGSVELSVDDSYDQLILNAECAYLIQDAIA